MNNIPQKEGCSPMEVMKKKCMVHISTPHEKRYPVRQLFLDTFLSLGYVTWHSQFKGDLFGSQFPIGSVNVCWFKGTISMVESHGKAKPLQSWYQEAEAVTHPHSAFPDEYRTHTVQSPSKSLSSEYMGLCRDTRGQPRHGCKQLLDWYTAGEADLISREPRIIYNQPIL